MPGRILIGVVAALVPSPAVPAASPQSLRPTPLVDDAAREAFWLEGEIVADRPAGAGVTGSRRVTLRRGADEHDAPGGGSG